MRHLTDSRCSFLSSAGPNQYTLTPHVLNWRVDFGIYSPSHIFTRLWRVVRLFSPGLSVAPHMIYGHIICGVNIWGFTLSSGEGRLSSCCCWCWSHFFYLQKMMQKIIFSKNKLSGDIGLMVQMLNLNFVAAAVSNYWENLFLLKMEKGA